MILSTYKGRAVAPFKLHLQNSIDLEKSGRDPFTYKVFVMGGLLSDGKFILGVIFALWRICSEEETPNFVFGESLVEAGNYNYLVTLSKANYLPHGIDLGKPTGRYTNGRTIIDIIGQTLGFKGFTPPYLAPTTSGPVILTGVNYASGGGGILNEIGKVFVGRINLDAQIDNFSNTREDIMSTIGVPAALKLLEGALFSVTIGSNDFLNNYLAPVISEAERKLIPPETFVGILIARLRLQITLKILVAALNDLPGAKFVYADVYSIVEDIIENYISYGFENANSACCRVAGRYGGLIPCGPQFSMVCEDRS
ncbi:hypothetical protein ACLB2K_034715 [Fragaria x ananassa]